MSSMEVISQIKKTEKEAEEIRRQAIQEAQSIINSAEVEAEELADRMLKETIERAIA